VMRSFIYARGLSLPASIVGKIKMVAQVVAILALILGPGHIDQFIVVGQIALWVATIAALVSAVDYTRRFNAALGHRPVPGPTPTTRSDAAAEARSRISA